MTNFKRQAFAHRRTNPLPPLPDHVMTLAKADPACPVAAESFLRMTPAYVQVTTEMGMVVGVGDSFDTIWETIWESRAAILKRCGYTPDGKPLGE